MYKHILTIALLSMGGFFYWMRTHAPATSTASEARTVLMLLVVGSIISAITNHASKE